MLVVEIYHDSHTGGAFYKALARARAASAPAFALQMWVGLTMHLVVGT